MPDDDDHLEAEDDDQPGVYAPGVEPDDEATEAMRPLFPDGRAHDLWEGVFDGPG
jgi:hypothetical protein